MKIYFAILLTAWTTWLTTTMAMKVGEMSTCSVNGWELPFVALFITLLPALLGYLFAKEQA